MSDSIKIVLEGTGFFLACVWLLWIFTWIIPPATGVCVGTGIVLGIVSIAITVMRGNEINWS